MAEEEAPRIYVEPPLPLATEFDSVQEIRAILNQHDAGRFRMSALLAERMLWNARLRAAVNTRLAGMLSAELRFEPARENRDARRSAREFAEDWPYMVTAPTRKQYRKHSLMLGFAIGQRACQLSPMSGRQIYRVRNYWPGFANWYWAEGGYRIQTYDAGVIDARSPGLKDVGAPSPTLQGLLNPSEQPWIIDEPNGANSWREAMMHASWRPWFGHEKSLRDQGRKSEKDGVGAVRAKVPRGTGEEHKASVKKYGDGLRTMGSEGVIVCEQREVPEASFDVEPFEFSMSGSNAIEATLSTCAIALAILWLGHNLTTEVKSGGSYAAAGVGEYIRDDIKGDDCYAEWAVFGPQLARPYCLLNYGDPELAPRARYVTDSMAVNRAMAQMLQAIAQAIQFFRQSVPRFDVDAFCEQWRIPLLPIGQVQVPPAPAKSAAPASTGSDDDELAAKVARLEARVAELEQVAA